MKKYFIFLIIIFIILFVSCKDNSDNNNDFVKQNIEMDSYAISVELPKSFVIDKSDNSDNTNLFASEMYNFDLFNPVINPNIPVVKIKKDDVIVGAVSLVNFDNLPEEQFEYYKKSHNFRALYSQFPMGSMVFWGEGYEVVYESETQREGSSTVLSYYRSDYLEQQNITDFSRFKQETVEGDPRINLYNRGILGYNLDFNKFVKIELYYDAVTNGELRHIAESLKIIALN